MSGTRLPPRKAPTQVYEIRSAIRTDADTAKLLQTTLEAVGTALFAPERVDWSVWLHLTMIAALADAAMHKNAPDRFPARSR